MNEQAAPIWKKLEAHRDELASRSLHSLFEEDPERFEGFSRTEQDLLVDFSKTKTTRETLRLLARARRGLRRRGAARRTCSPASAINSPKTAPCCMSRCATARTARSSSTART